MREFFGGGHLRYIDGCWLDDSGNPVDIMRVVRCEDCRKYNLETQCCKFWPDEGYRNPDHFCAEGQRKNGHETEDTVFI